MNDRSVRIAICIKDRVARQLACSMFSSVGADIQICDDTAAIKAAADAEDLQAVVLGLGAAPEQTFDALVMLRQWFAAMPIYVIADAAGQRHGKRTKAFGATHVIPHEELQRRVGQLVKAAAQAGKKDDWDARAPGWMPDKGVDGYEVQSMDLGAWLSVPGNRRLLGMKDAPGAAAGGAPPPASESVSSESSAEAPPPAVAPMSASTWSVAPPPAEPAAPLPGAPAPQAVGRVPAPAAAESSACGSADCSRLSDFRVEHGAQIAALLEAQKQREKRIQDQNQAFHQRVQTELREAIAASEAQAAARLDQRVGQEVAAAVRRLKRVVAILSGVVVLLCIGLVWRLGPW